ncbi:MAG: hypothetical protein AAFZ18_06010 [Myxococcota bacterium]
MGEELLDEVLGEAELELADVEDDLGGDSDTEVRAFRRALSEILEAEPSTIGNLERVIRRLENIGVGAAWQQLVDTPLLLQALRLTLEIFVRRNPTPRDYLGQREDEGGAKHSTELWEGHRRLLVALRETLS